MRGTALQLGFADDGVACALVARVFVLVWRGETTPERLERVAVEFDRLSASTTGELAVCGVIEAASRPPAPAEAARSAELFDARPRVTHTIGVLEGRGAWLTTVIDVALGINALRRKAPRTKLCTDTREAATWLATRHPHGLERLVFRDELLSAIERVRARIGADPVAP